MKLQYALLVLLIVLGGCQAPPIKPSARWGARLHRLLVVAVEAPPLEIIPDPIETRLPIYRQNDDLPYGSSLDSTIYRFPGGVLVTGLVSHDDIVAVAVSPRMTRVRDAAAGLEPAAVLGDDWMPSLVLAGQAVVRLRMDGVQAVPSQSYFRLPLAERGRVSANPAVWRASIRHWYGQHASPIDYGARAADGVDAVLEVGIGTYRIFEGQMLLQVLLKLIDPATGAIIGRTAAEAFPAPGSAESLLGRNAGKFKEAVAEIGAQLIARGLCELGLTSASRPVRSGRLCDGAALATVDVERAF